MGNPKRASELSNKRMRGKFKAISISKERITIFCSCLFFIKGCVYKSSGFEMVRSNNHFILHFFSLVFLLSNATIK